MLARTGCRASRGFCTPPPRPPRPRARSPSLLPTFARDSPRVRRFAEWLRRQHLTLHLPSPGTRCFRYTLYVAARRYVYISRRDVCAAMRRIIFQGFDRRARERAGASSIKRIVKNASTPMQIADRAYRCTYKVSGAFPGFSASTPRESIFQARVSCSKIARRTSFRADSSTGCADGNRVAVLNARDKYAD